MLPIILLLSITTIFSRLEASPERDAVEHVLALPALVTTQPTVHCEESCALPDLNRQYAEKKEALRALAQAPKPFGGEPAAAARGFVALLNSLRDCAATQGEAAPSCHEVDEVFKWNEPLAGAPAWSIQKDIGAYERAKQCLVDEASYRSTLRYGNKVIGNYSQKADTWLLPLEKTCRTSVGTVNQWLTVIGGKNGRAGVIITTDPSKLPIKVAISQTPGQGVDMINGSAQLELKASERSIDFRWSNGAYLSLASDGSKVIDSNFIDRSTFADDCRMREDDGPLQPKPGQKGRRFYPQVKVIGNAARMGKLFF
jgi:hypothetical protein